MDKGLKNILIALNSIVLLLSVFWFFKEKSYEPAIVFVSQLASILLITNESKIITTRVKGIRDNSTVDINESGESNSITNVEDVENSNVRISK